MPLIDAKIIAPSSRPAPAKTLFSARGIFATRVPRLSWALHDPEADDRRGDGKQRRDEHRSAKRDGERRIHRGAHVDLLRRRERWKRGNLGAGEFRQLLPNFGAS